MGTVIVNLNDVVDAAVSSNVNVAAVNVAVADAEVYASAAAESSSVATAQAVIATTKAGLASAYADEAALLASDAENSATAAGNYMNAALGYRNDGMEYLARMGALYDEFKDRYLGSYGEDPIVDNDGNALVEGTMYWNMVNKAMQIYTGAIWTSLSGSAGVPTDGALAAIHNLSDVPDKAIARSNLSVYSKTEGDTRYLNAADNLSDVASSSVVRTNLDVYSKAETAVQISNAVAGLIDAAPTALDTLNELAAAIGDDANFATTITNAIGTRVVANAAIVAGTKTKITYDTKGLVIGGSDLTASDIPDLSTAKITSGTLSVVRGGTGVTTSTGSGNVVLSTSPVLTTPNIGVATGVSFNSITGLSSVSPSDNGVAAAGTSSAAARADHVHNAQVSVSGNAGTATKLATARTIGMSGDVNWSSGSFDGSANVTAVATLSTTGVTVGTYKSVTVDAKGRVTAGTNPTTLAGYGITDAQPMLVSGTNIKTINGTSLIGSGDIAISGGTSALASLTDVTATATNGNSIFYNSTSSKWESMPAYTKAEVDTITGDIASTLDTINGANI